MSLTAAELKILVNADTAGAERGLKSIGDKTKEAGGGIKSFLGTVAGFATGTLVVQGASAAFGYLKGNIGDMISSGMEANQVAAQLAAGLKSTHDASGMTMASLDKLSTSIMSQTGIDDDAVKASESMLLTFTDIGKNVFPQATQAVADLATKMANGAVPSATQMEQASIQLGKALGNPLKGYTALQRVGVTFSDQQKEQIKHFMAINDVAGAQGVILKEMNKEFGGSAAAAGQANGGLAILQAQFENMKQSVGQSLIPVLSQVAQTVFPMMESAMQGVGSFVTGTLIPAIQKLAPVFSALWNFGRLIVATFEFGLKPGLEKVGQAFQKLMPHVNGVSGFMRVLIPILRNVQTFALNLGTVIGNTLAAAITTVLPILQQLATWFMTKVLPALTQLADFIAKNVIPVIISLVGWFGVHVVPVLEQVADIVIHNVVPAVEKIWGSIAKNLIPAVERLWDKLAPILIPVLRTLGWVFQNVLGPALSFIIDIFSGVVDAVSTLIGWIQNLFGWIGKVGDSIGGFFKNVGAGAHALHIPGFASGGTMASSGLAIVGEAGPELVALPGGAQITPLAGMRGGGGSGGPGGGGPVHIHVHVAGRHVAEAILPDLTHAIRVGTALRSW